MGIPCSNCKCRIHVKCSNVKNANRNFHEFRGIWQCENCLSSNFPFTSTDHNTLLEISFNSGSKPNKKFSPEVTIDEKLKLMLSYSKQSPWYAYTHPYDNETSNFVSDDIDQCYTIKSNFDYYDIGGFKKTKSLWNRQKSISIFHTNVCSLQANIGNLEDLLHDLDHTFDIIALSETWNPEKTKDTFLPKRIDGYLDYHGVTGSSLKGGCGLYVKDTFTPIPRKDLEFKVSDFGYETENCWIELINNSGPNILIGVFYRHPSRNNEIFLNKLKITLKKVNKEKKKTIICGDFNLNLLNFDNDKQVNSFLSTMFQQNFQPCITEPTRITNANKPSLVDNIFINTFDNPVCGNILEHISYDHLPNFVTINHEHKNKKTSEKKRDKRNFDPNKFQSELLDNGNLLLEILNAKDAETSYNTFLGKFSVLLDKHAPIRELSKKEKKIKKSLG